MRRLLGIVGYYSMLSVVMNGARTPAPTPATMPLPRLGGEASLAVAAPRAAKRVNDCEHTCPPNLPDVQCHVTGRKSDRGH